MIIPSSYRQVKTDDTVRKGDIYRSKNRRHRFANYALHSIGHKAGDYPAFTFWRPRKGVKVTPRVATPTPAQPTAKKNVTIVEFTYNWKSRRVQLISLDSQYLTGLEITHEGSRYSYQFKKYLRYKIDSGLIRLYHFGEPLTNS